MCVFFFCCCCSGGYNLKAGAGSSIELMKFDMGGCAAVFGAAKAIAQLRPKVGTVLVALVAPVVFIMADCGCWWCLSACLLQNVEVHFISALCENMVSAEAVRPGDVLVASNGKTIEVINTDAEGRLTLADALVYAEKLKVDVVVDLATLTGQPSVSHVRVVVATEHNMLFMLCRSEYCWSGRTSCCSVQPRRRLAIGAAGGGAAHGRGAVAHAAGGVVPGLHQGQHHRPQEPGRQGRGLHHRGALPAGVH